MTHREEGTDFDHFVSDLQKGIDEQERTLYSAKVVEEAHKPKNVGRIAEADARGLVHGWCGDTMEVYLQLDEGRIGKATFMTDGCGATLACGSMLTQMVTGMWLAEAEAVRPEDLLEALDGLPKENQHCAQLAVSTLQNAISNWRATREM